MPELAQRELGCAARIIASGTVSLLIIGVLALCSGLFVPAASSTDNNCDILVSPRAMVECYGRQLKNANQDLNEILKRLNKVLNANEQKALKGAQSAWLAYRDAHCESVALQYSPGSIVPAVTAACSVKLTRQRIKDLMDNFRDSLEASSGKANTP